ncbi:DUF4956 domain-containing protein, partial [Flavobacteriaceae bacterium]|nr:DUF4956 domain-containing protein [Flavobacteriaceae bacterium]
SQGLNRSINLSTNSIILSLIICVIIAVVKSSLALSLGLVGALSVVRFRNAVKDPNELLLYFSSIAIGISIGADQYLAAGMFSLSLLGFNMFNYKLTKKNVADSSSVLLIKTEREIDFSLLNKKIKKILKREFKLISMTNSEDYTEICFEIYDLNENELISIKELRKSLKISVLELIPSVY